MDANDIRSLVAFNCWARDRLLDAVEQLTPEQYAKPMQSSFSSVRDTVVHTYGAEFIWNARLRGEPPVTFPAPDALPDVASVRTAWAAVEARLRAFLAPLDGNDVNRIVEYQTFRFGPGRSSIAQIVQHVVNHATYHRGQVTTLLRQLGAAPPKETDLALFHREHA